MKNNVESTRDMVLKFIGSHYLDILYWLSGTSEVKNVFVQNRDEVVFTQNVLKYVKSKKPDLIDNWPLKKIVDNLEKENPLPNQNKSFAIKGRCHKKTWKTPVKSMFFKGSGKRGGANK